MGERESTPLLLGGTEPLTVPRAVGMALGVVAAAWKPPGPVVAPLRSAAPPRGWPPAPGPTPMQAHQHLKVAHQQLQEERQSAVRARKAGELAMAAADKARTPRPRPASPPRPPPPPPLLLRPATSAAAATGARERGDAGAAAEGRCREATGPTARAPPPPRLPPPRPFRAPGAWDRLSVCCAVPPPRLAPLLSQAAQRRVLEKEMRHMTNEMRLAAENAASTHKAQARIQPCRP